MDYCKEQDCRNGQAAICLHCEQRLCVYHVNKHAKMLLDDVNDLYQIAEEFVTELANASKSVQEAYLNAVVECNTRRLETLEIIEQTYDEMIQPIIYQKESFDKLEQDIKMKLSKDVIEPLHKMRTQRIGNVQALDAIRCVLEHVRCLILLMEWPQKPLRPLSTTKVNSTNMSTTRIDPTSSWEFENEIGTPLNKRSNPDVPTPWQMVVKNAHLRLAEQTTTEALHHNPISTNPTQSQMPTQQRTKPSDLNEQLKDYIPCKNMVTRFADVSTDGDQRLLDHLQNTLGPFTAKKRRKMRSLLKLLLAFLHAWYRNRPLNNANLVLQRISIIKNYLSDDTNKFTVILALQMFIHHIHKDTQIVQITTIILQFLFNQQLIREEDLLEWYHGNESHGFVGFDIAKRYTQEFISNLEATRLSPV